MIFTDLMLKLLQIFILCFSLLVSAYGQCATDPLTHLQTLLSAISSLQANFRQTTQQRGQSKTYQGQLFLMKPNRFRWQVQQPDKQLIVADGKNLWVYDYDLEQVTVQALREQIAEAPLLLLSGDARILGEVYRLDKYQKSGATASFWLVAKDESSLLNHVKIQFVDEVIHQITITDGLGTTTQLNLSQVQQNHKLSPDLFQFKPPAKVDVVGQPL